MGFRAGLTTVLESDLPGGGHLALRLANPETLLVELSTCGGFEPDHSYAVIDRARGEVEFSIEDHGDGVHRITTSALVIEVSTAPFGLRVEDTHGVVRFETTADALAIEGPRIRLKRSLGEGEGVYGLGEHGELFNRNPGVWRIWNRDDPNQQSFKQFYCGIPFAVSHPGGAGAPHAFFVDNPGELHFDVGVGDRSALRMESSHGDLRLWLFFEDSPGELLTQYTELTGRMERPPMWALGYQQCRWSYMTADRVRQVAAEFRKRRIPCDVIYMDIDYMQDYAVFTWNSKSFADHKSLLGELRDEGFSPLVIIDPGVFIKPGYFAYDEGLKTPGFFVRKLGGELVTERVWPGETHFPDFTNPSVRELWGKWQAETLLSIGIAGVWNDMNEPAVFATTTPTREFPSDAVHHDFGMHRTHNRVHNIYGLSMAQASCEGQSAHFPDKRPFTLTRSGWAGVQRYSSVWTGDNRSCFASMLQDVALNLSMGMSGVGFVGCDIGGFTHSATPELFTRWIEWGVFQAFCRGHSCMGTVDQEPWAFGQGTEVVARRMIELRYQLLPFLYTLFVEAAETGLPINRPLMLEYPTDATVANIGDQFLVGRDILVAPVLEGGKDRRLLYLPPGEWVHFWTGVRHAGAKWIVQTAPFGQPPIYVRAGAIIPMHPVRQHTKEAEPEIMFLDVWPAARMNGSLVVDDGETLAWKDGEELRQQFFGTESDTGLQLTIAAPQGSYKSRRNAWTVRLHHPERRVAKITVGGAEVPFELVGHANVFTLKDTKKPITIEVSYEG